MAMGIVSDSDFDKELEKLNSDSVPLLPKIEKLPKKDGRGNGNFEVPEGLRKIIGEEANINGRASALEIAKDFGISPSSVSAYTRGATSTASINNPNQEQVNHINSAKLRVSKKARKRLIMALNEITEDRIAMAKLHEISGVARDMAHIMKDMEPSAEKNGNNGINNNGPMFVFYKPEQKSEEDFQTIHVRE
jgi:predicted transcriptional regulator